MRPRPGPPCAPCAGRGALQPLSSSLELELAGHRRFGQIVSPLPSANRALSCETGEPLADRPSLRRPGGRRAVAVARVSRLLISSSREFVANAEAVRLT